MQLQQAFVHADADRSGSIDMSEVTQAFRNIGFTLEQQTTQTLLHKFSNHTGQLTFEGFLAAGAHLAHMKSIFEAHSGGQPAMTLNFNQLCVVGSRILP